MIKAVLFDLDGVLINTEHINTKAAVLSMQEQGINLSDSDKKLITGRNPVDYSVDFAKKYKFNRARMILRHKFFYDKFYHLAKPFKNSRRVVLDFKRKKFKTALVTASRLPTIRRALRVLKLPRSSFNILVTFEKCKKRKPAPDPYLIAARLLKVNPRECLVVEDSVAGVTAAKRAGAKCVAITTSFARSKLAKSDVIVDNIVDVRWFLC